jgi:3-phenylpropionate/trans-cinnamate dioxygenase ferredoxin reductase subunit
MSSISEKGTEVTVLHYDYLIVGGGMTADAAVTTLTAQDPQGQIGLISAESDPPYDRPPLTKGLWKDKDVDSVWRENSPAGATLHLNRRVERLNVDKKQAVDNEGQVYVFDKLLLATGGRPRRLPWDNGGEIIYYRTLADYRRVAKLAEEKRRFAVIGGGFIGSELAAALTMNGRQVVMVFPEEGICGNLFPHDLAEYVTETYRGRGVEVLPGRLASHVERDGDQLVLQTDNDDEILVDAVIAGIGIVPNTELAQAAGIETDDGILVDRHLRTNRPDVYAAGDVAAFYDPLLRKRRRVEHEDNALSMGEAAGRCMSGSAEPYEHSPFFYSDLFDLGYEAVGELDADLDTVADWHEKFRKGTVYYLHDGQMHGVLLWNVWGQVDAARKLIAERKSFEPQDLKGRLPE